MEIKTVVILLLLVAYASVGNGQAGSIKGRIVSYKNDPLDAVTVGIQNTPLGSVTDNKGQFMISNVPAGTYTLAVSSVGYVALKQNIQVEAGKTINLDLQLSENKQELQEVTVTGRLSTYKQGSSSLVTRTDAQLMEVPQSAQVISQQVIKDKQAYTLNEISRVLTGVKANNNMGGFTCAGLPAIILLTPVS